MAEQSGSQHFNNTIINDNARVHMGNVHHHCTRTRLVSMAWHLANIMFSDANSTDAEASAASLRKSLFITDPSVDLIDKKGLRVADTCEWVERNETYKAWLCGDPSLLWIFGGPGKGKTMLSIYLTQQFEKLHGKEVIYFFCSSEHETRSTATAVLRTLLWQMIVVRPGLTELISPYFDPPERTQAMLSTPGSLWEIFAKVIQSSELGKMQCLIDGLDECDDESSRWLASQFTELTSQEIHSNLHIVVASRHMSSSKQIKQVHLDPDNDQDVSDDIEKFASEKMEELSRRLNLTTEFCSHIQSQLLTRAGGTFLWIGYAMIELRSKRTSLEVEEAVRELPTALPALYGRMLRRIPSGKLDLITTLLHWVTLAVRPLSIGELENVVAWRVPERMDTGQALRDYVKLCEPMIIVQRDRVLLVHQSARDYFLRDIEDNDVVAERVRAFFADAQASLAKTCIRTFDKPTSELSEYAKLYWLHHLRSCSRSVQTLLVTDEPFFGKNSASRHAWWQKVARPMDHQLPRLHMACWTGLEPWARRVLTELSFAKADPKMQEPATSLGSNETSAQRRLQCVNYSFRGSTPLHFAARAKHSHKVVTFLLSNGADPNMLDMIARSPLAIAVGTDTKLDTIKHLLASGADPDGDFDSNILVTLTPLRKAIHMGKEELAIVLVGSGADTRAADQIRRPEPSMTALQLATMAGMKKLARLLLEHGADPQVEQGGAPIPLCLAVDNNHTGIVNLLLDRSAGHHRFHDDCTSWPVYTALARHYFDVAQKIIGFGVSRRESLVLWADILDGNVVGVTAALKRGVDPNTTTTDSPGCPRGLTSLRWAVVGWQHREYNTFTEQRYGAIIQRLLEHGADATFCDADGKTVLQRANAKGKVWAAVANLIARSKRSGPPMDGR